MTDDKQRSNEQNRYLRGPAYDRILEAMPKKPSLQNKEFWHEYWCGEFFGWAEIGFPGSGKVRPVRTTTTNQFGERDVISTKVFADMVTFIQAECAERGIDIPDPNEPPALEVVPEYARD